jgi:Tfp pilus assembly protein PilV
MCSDGRRRDSGRRRGRRGIGLLEALAATGLLAVALLALAGHSISVTRTAKAADSTSAATALALQKLEQLRSMPLGAAALDPGAYVDAANPMTADGAPGGIFERSWVVSGNNVPGFGLRTVIVTVAWTDSLPRTTRVAAYVRCATIPCA